jgi:proteic killer suppression protein
VIKTFADKSTQDIYDGLSTKAARKLPVEIHRRAKLLLEVMCAMSDVAELKIPRSNHLERLRDDLEGFWSIRINDQWRIIFRWDGGNCSEVKIVDYH